MRVVVPFDLVWEKPAITDTRESAKRTADGAPNGFTDEERAAMKEPTPAVEAGIAELVKQAAG